MKRFLLVFVLFLSVWSVAEAQTTQAQPTKEYVAALKKMMTASNSDATIKAMIPQLFAAMKQQLPNVPAEFWTELEKEVTASAANDFVEMLAPIYFKQLTQADLEAIIKFYETPVGKKMAAAQPYIATESMKIGQQWGMSIGMKVQEALKAKGYLQ